MDFLSCDAMGNPLGSRGRYWTCLFAQKLFATPDGAEPDLDQPIAGTLHCRDGPCRRPGVAKRSGRVQNDRYACALYEQAVRHATAAD